MSKVENKGQVPHVTKERLKERIETTTRLLAETPEKFDEVFSKVALATKEEHKKVMEDIQVFQKAMIDYAIDNKRSIGGKCGFNGESFHVRVEGDEVATRYTNKGLDNSKYIESAKKRLIASVVED